jgi:hypothetical protein
MNYITFDIETYIPEGITDRSSAGKLDTENMRVSVTGAYFSWLDKYIMFWEDQTEEFIEMLTFADYIVGYNHVGFDLKVLQKYAKYNLQSLNNYDIMLEFQKKAGHRIKLDTLAKANLEVKKSDSFANFRNYYKDGKFFELADYCAHDVLITEQLHKIILSRKELQYTEMLTTRNLLLDLPVQKDVIIKYDEAVEDDSEAALF